jgi:amino acid transporter
MTSLLNLLWGYPNSFGWIYFLYGMILLGAGLINMFRVTITAFLNTVSAWWHMVGVVVIVFILGIVPDHHRSITYVFGETVNNSGFGGHSWTHGIFIYVFLTGLLMAQYTITGYDASAHMSEETRRASRAAAWGIVMSVVVSVIFGFILLVAVTFAIPSSKGPADTGLFIVTSIWESSMGRRWAEFLLFIAVVAQCFCTTASVTSASRMMFAFSRDRAVPGHRVWRRVSRRERVPVFTVTAVCVLSFLLVVPSLWFGYTGYVVATSVAVIGLYIAFVLPIVLRLRAGDRFEPGAWSLGPHYKWIDWLAILWIAFISIVFFAPFAYIGIPWNKGFDWNLFNYTIVTVGGAFVLFGGWYVLSARRWFKGPIREGTDEELEQIEAGFGAVPTMTAEA